MKKIQSLASMEDIEQGVSKELGDRASDNLVHLHKDKETGTDERSP